MSAPTDAMRPHCRPFALSLWVAFVVSIVIVAKAFAVNMFEITEAQDTAYHKYRMRSLDQRVVDKNCWTVNRRLQVLEPAIGDTGRTISIHIATPDRDSDNPVTIDRFTFPPLALDEQRSIRIRILTWELYNDQRPGMKRMLGVGLYRDTAWALRLDPYSWEIEKLFLMTGEDGTGDGKWEPELSILLSEDYDYDGHTEAFVYVNRVREKGLRTLFCIDLESLTIEWALPVASAPSNYLGFWSCQDSLNPSVIFATHGSCQGAVDENYTDIYSYLSIVNQHGEITYNRVAKLGADGLFLLPAESPGEFYLAHEFIPVGIDSLSVLDADSNTSSLQAGGFCLSKIDRKGRILHTRDIRNPGSWGWLMPYDTHRVAVYMRHNDQRVRVYDTSLTLLAVSDPVNIGQFQGTLSIEGEDSALIFDNGIYSRDFELLVRHPWCRLAEPSRIDRNGTVRTLALTHTRGWAYASIEKKSRWELLSIFYVNNKVYFLAAFSSLLVGLIVVNFYRRRSKRNLGIIARQKAELEETHASLKHAQAQIVAQAEYRQAKDIAGGFAHEIRNALSPARNALTKLTADATQATPEKSRNLIDLTELAVIRAVNLTQLISNYTRIEAASNPESVIVSDIVADVLKAHGLDLQDNGISVTCPDSPTAPVLGNNEQLRVVFANLVRNAQDALDGRPSPAISVDWQEKGKHLLVSVSDNGSGIATENLNRIFDFFYSTKPNSGTGVGLAMVKKIVEMYGGTITVESKPASGSTFHVRFRLIES